MKGALPEIFRPERHLTPSIDLRDKLAARPAWPRSARSGCFNQIGPGTLDREPLTPGLPAMEGLRAGFDMACSNGSRKAPGSFD